MFVRASYDLKRRARRRDGRHVRQLQRVVSPRLERHDQPAQLAYGRLGFPALPP